MIVFQINGYSSDFKSVYRKYLGCSKRAKDRTRVGKTKHSISRWTLSSGCRVVPVEGLILRGAWCFPGELKAWDTWQDRGSQRVTRGTGSPPSLCFHLNASGWEAPVCVAGAECPPSRNLAKPLASGKCLCGGSSVGYFFFTYDNE